LVPPPRFPPKEHMPGAPKKVAAGLAEKPNPALEWKAKVFDGHGEAGGGDKKGCARPTRDIRD
jgi:hypothetical protein